MLITGLLLQHTTQIAQAASYNIDFEDAGECSVAPSSVSKSLFLQNPLPNMSEINL